MSLPTNAEIELAELETVLASRTFARSPNLIKMLRFIGNEVLNGRHDTIKEYIIGVEALGRPPEFDPKQDSVVRVEAFRLRKKLEQYYKTEGAGHPITISLQAGNYIPQFHRRGEAHSDLALQPFSDLQAGGNGPMHDGSSPSRQLDGPGQPHPLPVTSLGGAFAGRSVRKQVGRLKWRVVLALLIVAAGIAIWAAVRAEKAKVGQGSVAAVSAGLAKGSTTAVAPVGSGVRIIAGSSQKDYVDTSGEEWGSDRYFSGGQAYNEPRAFIARTSEPTLFQTARTGVFSYSIPLKPGTYELRLYFVETEYGPAMLRGGGENSRVFSINLNGKPLLTNFDIYSDAGGSDIADVRVFKDVSPAADGSLHLSFIKGVSDPLLNALEIFPSPPGEIRPIRIVTRKTSYTDAAGQVWKPDRYFMGGRLATSVDQVQGTQDPGLYSEERYGNFSYAIPVAAGRYTVTLYFAETYFGPDNLGGSGEGSRVFNVDCNGIALLQNFDILEAAGGDNRAVVRTFHGLQPNAQGKLLLSFVPIRNYASVQAIEVTAEPR